MEIVSGKSLSIDIRNAKRKYNKEELGLLDQMFRDLAGRSPDDLQTISKETFMQVFKLPGILADRLFDAFDTKRTKVIDFDEFVLGLAKYVRGDMNDKIEMLFKLFDMDTQGYVTRNELQTVLFSLITPAISFLPSLEEDEKRNGENDLITTSDGIYLSYKSKEVVEKIEKMVSEAFEECDLDQSGGLDLQQFQIWCKKHPEVTQGLESILVQNTWAQDRDNPMYFESLYHADHINQSAEQKSGNRDGATKSCSACNFQFYVCRSIDRMKIMLKTNERDFNDFTFCPVCGKKLMSSDTRTYMPIVKAEDGQGGLFSGVLLEPVSGKFKTFSTRYAVLRGRFLYFFKNEKDQKSGKTKKVHFIQGWFIEKFDIPMIEAPHLKNRGFKLIPPRGTRQLQRILFAETPMKATKWIHNLQVAAQTLEIQHSYIMEDKLGSGAFSIVRRAKRKSNGDIVAVKCIIKKKISAKEKQSLHIEIAAMKLVKHPNIIQLYEIFESLEHIYLVMPVYPTDMYNRLTKRGLYTEAESKMIIWRLLNALEYLHTAGIVHRDLKPENILLKNFDDISEFVIADFGLSKFASPQEVMNLPCGTITYVAPEVLKLRGYGKMVDVWSTGVIAYVMLRGRLPFEAPHKRVIIHKILNTEPAMVGPKWRLISALAKDLVGRLLTKAVNSRPTIKEALRHQWFEGVEEQANESLKSIISLQNESLNLN